MAVGQGRKERKCRKNTAPGFMRHLRHWTHKKETTASNRFRASWEQTSVARLWMPRPHSDTTIPGRVGRSSTAVCWSGRPHGTFTPARISGRRPPCLCLGLDGSIIVAASVIAHCLVRCRAACALTAMRVMYCVCRIFSCQRASGKSSPHL